MQLINRPPPPDLYHLHSPMPGAHPISKPPTSHPWNINNLPKPGTLSLNPPPTPQAPFQQIPNQHQLVSGSQPYDGTSPNPIRSRLGGYNCWNSQKLLSDDPVSLLELWNSLLKANSFPEINKSQTNLATLTSNGNGPTAQDQHPS